jgi:hypothetical protein
MKKLMTILSVGAIMTACSDSKDRYIDLSTGKPVEIVKDEKTGYMVNKETNEALYIYVDTKKKDTIYAQTGKVINGHVVYNENKKYVFDEDVKLAVDKDGGVNYKAGDYKMEVEKDGDIKIKDGEKTIKIDGKTGERKVKND